MASSHANPHSEASLLARFMGLPKWSELNDLDLVDEVERGLPTSTVDTILRRMDPKGEHLKVTDFIPKATYYRLKNTKLTQNQSERILALSRVLADTMRQYHDDRELAVMFLTRPHPMLGGRAPFELAKSSIAGADVVMDLLARLEAGVAV